MLCLMGCGKDTADGSAAPAQGAQQNHVTNGTQETQQNHAMDGTQIKQKNGAPLEHGADQNTSGDGKFYDGSDLAGSVVEFSDEGFSLSPATAEHAEGGGEIMTQAAPGSENEEDNVQITYTDQTVFRIVNLSMDSQSEISREDTDKESVKKQSSVCIFGSCQDTCHWTADKILILRWQ